MAKKKQMFVCNSCGSDFAKWMGKCTECGSWNSIVECDSEPPKRSNAVVSAKPLSEIETESFARLKSGLSEFNLVCGGGIVPGSVVLIGGEPGIGKSTLSLQIAKSFRTLYISGEESPVQIKERATRLGIDSSNILLSSNTVVEDILTLIDSGKPEAVFIDSIQTVSSSEVGGPAGSVSQIRESAVKLTEAAKRLGIPLFIIGHITKEGSIAGPKILEHVVDTVLYFEGDFTRDYRILRSFKNRFGSVNEIGLFSMEADGLREVKDKNAIFLNPYDSKAPGNAVCAAIEGSRVILFEVQSLVTFSAFANPRRMADGFDLNRLILLVAVLEKHAGIKLSTSDVFINVAGGFRINETASDMAVAISIVSSFKNAALPLDICFLGEISLSGEIRPVSQSQRRIQEIIRNGFKTLVVSAKDAEEAAKQGFEGRIIKVKNIGDVIKGVF